MIVELIFALKPFQNYEQNQDSAELDHEKQQMISMSEVLSNL